MKLKKTLILFAAFFIVGILHSGVSAQIKVKNKDFSLLAGDWTGELEYLDYQDDKSKTKLKLRSTNTVADGKISQEIVYVEPNGKEVKSAGAFALSPDGRQIVEEKIRWTITKNEYDKKSKTRTIVYETKWKDNDRNADLRETMIIGENEFSVTKEVRYENTNDFFVRNTHRYTRK